MNSDKTRMKDSQEDILTMYEVRAGHSGETTRREMVSIVHEDCGVSRQYPKVYWDNPQNGDEQIIMCFECNFPAFRTKFKQNPEGFRHDQSKDNP